MRKFTFHHLSEDSIAVFAHTMASLHDAVTSTIDVDPSIIPQETYQSDQLIRLGKVVTNNTVRKLSQQSLCRQSLDAQIVTFY